MRLMGYREIAAAFTTVLLNEMRKTPEPRRESLALALSRFGTVVQIY
jgi:hypothetical protein